MDGKTVGFIGVGRMGRPMARRILGAGFSLHVFDLAPAAVSALVESGAIAASSPRALAGRCDVVITMLPGPAEVEAVVEGVDGVVEGILPDSVLVDMSTSSPSLSKQIAAHLDQKGARFLDAPVSGGAAGAEEGSLTLMVGGKPEVLDECRGVLEPMAGAIYHLGGVGAGHTVKLLNQMLIYTQAVSAMEVLGIAARTGVDLPALHEIVARSTGDSWWWRNRVARITGTAADTRMMQLDLWYKDLKLATELGKEAGVPLFTADAASHVFQIARGMNLGGEDGMVALARTFERMLDVQFAGRRKRVMRPS